MDLVVNRHDSSSKLKTSTFSRNNGYKEIEEVTNQYRSSFLSSYLDKKFSNDLEENIVKEYNKLFHQMTCRHLVEYKMVRD